MLDAFDSDCLIYAAAPDHVLGRSIRHLINLSSDLEFAGIGSTLLIPEVLTKPSRSQNTAEVRELGYLLSRVELRPVDRFIGQLAVVVGARHGLKAADAIHLATAINCGADRFITNNRRDFDQSQITEIAVVHPDQL